MKLLVQREPSTAHATTGSLFVDGKFECFTLEDVVREISGAPVDAWKIKGETAIPRGEYRVIIDFSNHFGREMPHLLDVPGYEGVRIHSGNTDADTEGCILVGKNKYFDRLGNSRVAFSDLFAKLEAAYERNEPITVEVA